MRRVLLFAAFLLLLGLTTAAAASFDVQAEDITAFSSPVSIDVPTTQPPDPDLGPVATSPWYLFGAPPAPGGLSTNPETSNSPYKADIEPSGTESIIGQSTVTKYYVWSSGVLADALNFKNQTVTLDVYLTAGGKAVEAALLDCPAGAPLASTRCGILGLSGTPTTSGNKTVAGFGTIAALVDTGRELRLKIVNRQDKTWTVEWGRGTSRDSQLIIGAAPS